MIFILFDFYSSNKLHLSFLYEKFPFKKIVDKNMNFSTKDGIDTNNIVLRYIHRN